MSNLGVDVKIADKKDKNGAMSGDIVFVELNPRSDWLQMEKPRDAIINDIYPNELPTGKVVFIEQGLKSNSTFYCAIEVNKPEENVDPSTFENNDFFYADSRIDVTSQMTGGSRFPLRARCMDSNIPWLLLDVNYLKQNPFNIFGEGQNLKEYTINPMELYPIVIESWAPGTQNPVGRLSGPTIGQAGDPEVEIKYILQAYNMDGHLEEFSDAVKAEVEDVLREYAETMEEEIKRRVDLRHLRVMTIDPATARDLDDAVHMLVLKDAGGPGKDHYEFGVHIADVSHFVKEGTALDEQARKKCLTAYLPPKAYHMLPPALAANLCSLNANENKFAYSAIFRVDERGELLPRPDTPTSIPLQTTMAMEDPPGTFTPRFFRSVIRSVCRWNYEEAQEIIDQRDLRPENRPPVSAPWTWEDVCTDIQVLDKITQKIRERRFEKGGFRLDKIKLRFEFADRETSMVPCGYHYEDHTTSHELVEELMLLANRVVAEKLFFSPFRNFGVLRNHKGPKPREIKELLELLVAAGVASSAELPNAKQVQQFFHNVNKRFGPSLLHCLQIMIMRTMTPAEYFVPSPATINSDKEDSFKEPWHFALFFQFYSHFTSPIRRYPDIMLHRGLTACLVAEAEHFKAILDPKQTPSYPPQYLSIGDEAAKKIYGIDGPMYRAECENNNEMKNNSRKMQERADVSFFAMTLREKGAKPKYTIGYCFEMKDRQLSLWIPEFNATPKIMFETTRSKPSQKILPGFFKYVQFPRKCEQTAPFTTLVDFRQAVEESAPLTADDQMACRDGMILKVDLFTPVPVICVPNNKPPIEPLFFIVSPVDPQYKIIMEQIEKEKVKPDGSRYEVPNVDALNASEFANKKMKQNLKTTSSPSPSPYGNSSPSPF
eukprot:GDKJ01036306.1.p1 GENE.GDKJ01036306.1~~GDKJ01036306.1.p1  ORF type:complete len:943 (-),score=244.42 GDKJ01036306.1:497-3154(-)